MIFQINNKKEVKFFSQDLIIILEIGRQIRKVKKHHSVFKVTK